MENILTLPPSARKLVEISTAWFDPYWDPATGLLWSPSIEKGPKTPLRHHIVRDTIWYALGLFLRRSGSDVFRGLQSIQAILDHQFDSPGTPFHGTFRRSPEEQDPTNDAVEWKDYDPNWREFICTVFDLMLIEFPSLIPGEIEKKINNSFRLAIEGTLARGLKPNYTNIALMHAYLLCSAGNRLNEPNWVKKGEEFAKSIYALFSENGAFEEYNSPTYYGVDLFALGLWRKYKPTPLLAALGEEMENRLWRDISRYYHPVLRTMCGPYDRAYDMDMRSAVGVLGEWISLITGLEQAPFPETTGYFSHAADLCFSPCAAILGANMSEEIKSNFLHFVGERWFSQVITSDPKRVASAWLSDRVMVGAQHTSLSKKGYPQFHPITIHWLLPDGNVGWIRAKHSAPVDASTVPGFLNVSFSSKIEFEIFSGNYEAENINQNEWTIAGLSITLQTPLSFGKFSLMHNHLFKTYSCLYEYDDDTLKNMSLKIEVSTS
jgi:hypothetical protein